MTALRELAERWKAANRGETLYVAGKTSGMHACAAELLAILDAEGDGGAVAELVVDRDSGNREWFDIKVFDRTLPHGTKLYTHPARSGVVRDEDVASENEDRKSAIRDAVECNGGEWPQELTSGVMFFRGQRITRRDFYAATQGERHE